MKTDAQTKLHAEKVIAFVYDALKARGYNPVAQITGYLLSGDPSFITNYNGARAVISQVERDDLIELFLKKYVDETIEKKPKKIEYNLAD